MERIKVCIIDSGVGGVSILHECTKLMPNVDFLYYADDENCPYGNKTIKSLTTILCNIVTKINSEFNIKIFVLACNTATAMCVQNLRIIFPNFLFIGTEPNIKTALKNKGNILVLTTIGTFKHSKFLKTYKNKKEIYFAPQKKLAKLIDENLENLENLLPILKKELCNYTKFNIKNIVLGCTHYYFISKQLLKIFPNIKLFDSSFGVAKRLQTLIYEEYKTTLIDNNNGKIYWKNSSNNTEFLEKIKKIYEFL